MKKDSCMHANGSRMLCWTSALPAEDVPNSLARIQMAGCPLGVPASKPGNTFALTPLGHLPLFLPPVLHTTSVSIPECHLQAVFQNQFFGET